MFAYLRFELVLFNARANKTTIPAALTNMCGLLGVALLFER